MSVSSTLSTSSVDASMADPTSSRWWGVGTRRRPLTPTHHPPPIPSPSAPPPFLTLSHPSLPLPPCSPSSESQKPAHGHAHLLLVQHQPALLHLLLPPAHRPPLHLPILPPPSHPPRLLHLHSPPTSLPHLCPRHPRPHQHPPHPPDHRRRQRRGWEDHRLPRLSGPAHQQRHRRRDGPLCADVPARGLAAAHALSAAADGGVRHGWPHAGGVHGHDAAQRAPHPARGVHECDEALLYAPLVPAHLASSTSSRSPSPTCRSSSSPFR